MKKNYKIDFSNFLKQLRENDQLSSIGSIIDLIHNYEDMFPGDSKYIPDKGFDDVISSLLKHRIELLINELYYITEKCESPIEVIMLYGLLIVGQECHDTVNVRIDHKSLFKVVDSPYELLIEPQKIIKNYRVDFLLTATNYNPKFEKNGYYQKRVIVECDGHHYHDRTKEQAKRDKSKDRKLQSLGYEVYRYTGSEIWQDIMSGVQEIMNYFANRNIA